MAKKKQKKNVSSWKKKKQYSVLASENFDYKELGLTVAADPALLAGRTVEKSLSDLTNDRRKQHLRLIFEINRVEDDKAYTRFKKFYTPTGYLKYRVKKGNSKIDVIGDFKFAGEDLRVKILILTRWRLSVNQRKEVAATANKVLENYSKQTPEQLVQLALFGKLGTDVYKQCRKIAPINRVEAHYISRI